MTAEELEEQCAPDLNSLYTDLLMLQDGSWEPDDKSIEASLLTIRELADTVNVELRDTREGE